MDDFDHTRASTSPLEDIPKAKQGRGKSSRQLPKARSVEQQSIRIVSNSTEVAAIGNAPSGKAETPEPAPHKGKYDPLMTDTYRKIQALPGGFQLPTAFRGAVGILKEEPPTSDLADEPASLYVQLLSLSAGEGTLLYHPNHFSVDPGDVLYLRQHGRGENGLIIQVVTCSIAEYPNAATKSMLRLNISVAAREVQRSHHEPAEVIDEFLIAHFRVRATIQNGQWSPDKDRMVTRCVDVFRLSPQLLLRSIIRSAPPLDIELGSYRGKPVRVFGGALGMINAVVGNKGSGKSHLSKGIIHTSRQRGVSTVIFDSNDEHRSAFPDALILRPGENLFFRLDQLSSQSFISLLTQLSPLAEKTFYAVAAKVPYLIRERVRADRIPDIAYLKACDKMVIPGAGEASESMRAAYIRSLENLERHSIIMTERQALDEDTALLENRVPRAMSFTGAFSGIFSGKAEIVVLQIARLREALTKVVVSLVLDYLRDACDRQAKMHASNPAYVPIYPALCFEEAQEYMTSDELNALLPVIRHVGMVAWYVTNSPSKLPDVIFRLADNILVTQLLNTGDIARIAESGLADQYTIQEFAQGMRRHHALLLSGASGATQGFPLVFSVRDFGLPASGVTRSQWAVMHTQLAGLEQGDGNSEDAQTK